ncbi:MAG: hypothetical protein ACRYF4_04590 [Janthinobacterium lividum]
MDWHHFTTPLSNLVVGLLGVLVGTLIAGRISWRIQRDTQNWALQAELKRHRVGQIAKAVEGLRVCYFKGVTELEYHLIELRGFENAERSASPLVGLAREYLGAEAAKQQAIDEIKRFSSQRESERIAYNAVSSKTESEAKAHFESLLISDIPPVLLAQAQAELNTLTEGFTTDSTSVQKRINLYKDRYEPVMQVLKKISQYNEAEITRAIPLSESSKI